MYPKEFVCLIVAMGSLDFRMSWMCDDLIVVTKAQSINLLVGHARYSLQSMRTVLSSFFYRKLCLTLFWHILNNGFWKYTYIYIHTLVDILFICHPTHLEFTHLPQTPPRKKQEGSVNSLPRQEGLVPEGFMMPLVSKAHVDRSDPWN